MLLKMRKTNLSSNGLRLRILMMPLSSLSLTFLKYAINLTELSVDEKCVTDWFPLMKEPPYIKDEPIIKTGKCKWLLRKEECVYFACLSIRYVTFPCCEITLITCMCEREFVNTVFNTVLYNIHKNSKFWTVTILYKIQRFYALGLYIKSYERISIWIDDFLQYLNPYHAWKNFFLI